MELLDYSQREALKASGDQNDIDLAHYHRFLEPFAENLNGVLILQNPPVTFETYRRWKEIYPGWSYGYMTPRHLAWKPTYAFKLHPMNEIFKKSKKSRMGC